MKKPNVTFTDFTKLDIRVGEVKAAKQLENSNKLIELTVDLGEEYGTVTILTGMAKFHKPEEFAGKKFLFIANLEPRPMAGSVSNGMIMSADENNAPVLVEIQSTINTGLPIT